VRKIAVVKTEDSSTKRVIVYETDLGTYVFPCATLEDGSATGDYWFEDLIQADDFCSENYGIHGDDWHLVDDPQEGCQHDWLSPVRIKTRSIDNRGTSTKMERYENGEWSEFDHSRINL
jgi:hypothetical protein